MISDFNDLVGKKIGKLTVLKYVGKQPSNKYLFVNWENKQLYPKYKVKCECGKSSIVRRQFLRKKKVNNGCKYCSRRNYRSVFPKTYSIWTSLKERCYTKIVNHYTANNIKVCDRWLESFENFLEDMGEKPKYKILLRRIKKRNFCKANCKWGTYKNSIKRQSNTNLVLINGITKSLKEWFKYFKFTEYQYDYFVSKRNKKKSLREKFNLKETDEIIENYKITR